MSNRLRSAIIVIVAIVWAANFTAPIFVKDFKPAPELNVAFMAIIGILTASYKKEDKSEDSDPEKRQVRSKPEPAQSGEDAKTKKGGDEVVDQPPSQTA